MQHRQMVRPETFQNSAAPQARPVIPSKAKSENSPSSLSGIASQGNPGRGNWLRNGNRPGDPNNAPRCGAKTRKATPCRSPAMPNGRCRMHGGASTGPRTAAGLARSRHAHWKHGRYSSALRLECRLDRWLLIMSRYFTGRSRDRRALPRLIAWLERGLPSQTPASMADTAKGLALGPPATSRSAHFPDPFVYRSGCMGFIPNLATNSANSSQEISAQIKRSRWNFFKFYGNRQLER